MWKKFSVDLLNFTKKERSGNIIILIIIVLLCLLPFIFPLFVKDKKYNHSNFEKEIATLKIKQADSAVTNFSTSNDDYPAYYQPSEKNYPSKNIKGELFYFDPNTLNEEGWKKLGLRDKTIATIKNYLSKGGKFKKPDDIGKIWGLSKQDAERLIPFVQLQIESKEKSYTNFEEAKPVAKQEKKIYTPTSIDVNVADTTAFISLPGIGSKLSQRIINFREKLGGFYKVEQVAETFGLPDSTYQKIKDRLVLKTATVKQININTATIDELKSHPYLRYTIANAIVQYRNQHGNFSSVNDLKKVMAITEDIFLKASPYLKVE